MFMSKFSNVLENFTWHVIVNEVLGRRKDRKEEFKPKVFNVWSFSKCDPKFGIEGYPGRIPGQIVQNVLYYFTSSKDALIVDPMAGSGTTWDVCKFMGYPNCLCYDIQSEEINKLRMKYGKEPCIKFNDILQGLPEESSNSDLILLDPPYYNLLEEDYPKNEFTESFDGFLKAMKTSFKHCFECVKNEGILALIMKPQELETLAGSWRDTTFELVKITESIGFTEIKRICAPLSTEQFQPYHVESAKKEKRILNTLRDIVIFRK